MNRDGLSFMKRFFGFLLVLLVSGFLACHIVSQWRGFYPYEENLSPEGFLKAIRFDPTNPDPYYRLGIFYQWEIRNLDLHKSLHYLRKAIERNPLEQEYWLSLAKAFQRLGDSKAAEEAMEKAIRVFPTHYRGRWTAGTLFLRQGQYEKALPHFSYILAHYPNQSSMVYDIWRKVAKDHNYLLAHLVPQDPFSLSQYLSYLYEAADKDMAQKVWEARASLGYKADRVETLRYVDFLISRGDLAAAYGIYKNKLQEEGLPVPSGGNLIINGGFEKEKFLGGGFDWKIGAVPGAEIACDKAVAFEGKHSLRIVFNGKENLEFHHVYQFMALRPNCDYLLKAHIKTKGVTTKSGIKISIAGIGQDFLATSEPLTGDNEWKELAVPFRTPSQSQGGVVGIRRDKTDKFDRFIAGTVWVDNVRLMEKGLSN